MFRRITQWVEAILTKNLTTSSDKRRTINRCEVTTDTITGRGGLTLFARYLEAICIFPHFERLFGSIRKNRKGLDISEIFKQILCFMVDGTCRHLVYFDQLKNDPGYAATIETDPDRMLSSHAAKRFFKAFSWLRVFLFRRLLQRLFIWRLLLEKPECIHIGIDTMVMDNDDAKTRHGVKPTYKKKKGFQPLQLYWNSFVIDSVFRSGNKHSNYSDTVEKMLSHVVGLIRKHYRQDVPILLALDSGFFDQKLFAHFESLKIGYICGGKLYKDITDYISSIPDEFFDTYKNGNAQWQYVEFGSRRGSWSKFRRAIYCSQADENGQLLLKCCRPDTVIYSNLGMGQKIDELLKAVGMGHLLDSAALVKAYHQRARDELVNRALKDFACEKLPFKRFNQNSAYYYTILTAFFLFECFKADVLCEVTPVAAYATTIRRKVIDIAVKIVKHSGDIILKVTQVVWDSLGFAKIWERSGTPPVFYW